MLQLYTSCRPRTRSLDRFATTKIRGFAAAISGLKALIEFDPALKFSSDSEFTFSGVSFSGLRLKTVDVKKLSKSGPTYQAAHDLLTTGRHDVFIVTEVDSTKSITVTSDTEFQVTGGTTTSSEDACGKKTAPPKSPHTSTDTGTPPTDAATTSSSDATKVNKQTSQKLSTTKLSGSQTPTVAQAQADTAKVDQKAKDSAAAGSEMRGNITVCKRTSSSYIFLNDIPVPSALKVVRLVLLPSGILQQRVGEVTVPLGDSKLLHRLPQNSDPYDPPHPKN